MGRNRDDNQTGGAFQGVDDIMLSPGEELPVPSKRAPWGNEEKPDSLAILNPYRGFQLRQLDRDATCGLKPDDFAGFLGFSAKLWLPDRPRCKDIPPKGPPILSCWKEWNRMPIPKPSHELLGWGSAFEIRLHAYQARDLPARSGSGVASAFVRLNYAYNERKETHVAYLTNSPTWDSTLTMPDVEVNLLPDQADFGTSRFAGADMYLVNAEDAGEVKENQARPGPAVCVCVLVCAWGVLVFVQCGACACERRRVRAWSHTHKNGKGWVTYTKGEGIFTHTYKVRYSRTRRGRGGPCAAGREVATVRRGREEGCRG